jgi:hypothetical protein
MCVAAQEPHLHDKGLGVQQAACKDYTNYQPLAAVASFELYVLQKLCKLQRMELTSMTRAFAVFCTKQTSSSFS